MTPAEKCAENKPRRKVRSTKVVRSCRMYPWNCTLSEERQRLRLALSDVAKAVGMSITGVFQIEKGCEPSLKSAVKIAAFFGKSVDEMWTLKRK